MSGQPDKCPHCEPLGGVLGEIRDRLKALELGLTTRPLSVQHKDAPAVLGIGKTSFERYVAPFVPCWREGSMRVYAIKDLERFLDQHKAKVLDRVA